MLKKILKWVGIGLGSLMLIVLLFYGTAHFQTEAAIDKVYTVRPKPLTIPTDSATYRAGRHLAEIRGCLGCHGADLSGGRAFADEASPIGILYAANITAGKGGLTYTDADWVRALRHGLGKDGRSLWFMPSHEIYIMSNQDMAALIHYVKSQPAVDRTIPHKSIKPLGRVLTFMGKFPLLTAERINHDTTYAEVVVPAVTADYGRYLAITCSGCHGHSFKGAAAHGPAEPPIPDISSTGKLGNWTQDGFVRLFRTGKTPEGRVLSEYMPVKEFTYSDDELKAIYLFLHGVK